MYRGINPAPLTHGSPWIGCGARPGIRTVIKTEKQTAKLIYKLEEICRITRLNPSVIEKWEDEFDFLQPGQTAAGQKIFRKKDLDIILRLKELLEEQGHTLAGARRSIEEEFQIKGGSPVHPELLRRLLFRIREELKDISSTLKE